MVKTIFKQLGSAYTMQGDYHLSNLIFPAKEECFIGV